MNIQYKNKHHAPSKKNGKVYPLGGIQLFACVPLIARPMSAITIDGVALWSHLWRSLARFGMPEILPSSLCEGDNLSLLMPSDEDTSRLEPLRCASV